MTKQEFFKLTEEGYCTIPVSCTSMADLVTPVGAALALNLSQRPFSFLLESVGGSQSARYSFLGITMDTNYQIRDRALTIQRGAESQTIQGDPLLLLREEIERRKAPPGEIPLSAGLVGYLGYDLVAPHRGGALPDGYLMSPQELLIFDHAKRTVRAVVNVAVEGLPPTMLEAAYRGAKAQAQELLRQIQKPPLPTVVQQLNLPFASNTKRDKFVQGVREIKAAIKTGVVEQVVLSQRLVATGQAHPLASYRLLRSINPSPYMFWLHFPELDLVGSSPEVLVTLEGRGATIRPIAGTRPRGRDSQEDRKLALELLADQKELSEHKMLVELGGKDLAAVAKAGTLRQDGPMCLERYSHVMHLVSQLSCELDPKYDAIDLLGACFPAGTVSGAPREEAMELIAALEPHSRGPYGGGVGYFSLSGNMDICIAIRMLVFQGKRIWVQAGAGIVAESEPQAEYEETLAKAQALLGSVAVEKAKEVEEDA